MKTALICGVSGQDGSLLARLLLNKGYRVIGTSRDAQTNSFANLARLGIRGQVETVSMTLTDFRSVLQTITNAEPDEIYNLAGQTSVGLSFEMPVETLESISLGTLNLLEAIRFTGTPIRLYNSCSSECFGNTDGKPANEATAFRPRSPYAVAKATAFWEVANYREAYGIDACSGILSNHESPLRPERFVTMKIINAVKRIAAGDRDRLYLGDLNVERDWGWAAEYVEAMWKMVQQQTPADYVIATGETQSLERFVELAFEHEGMHWREHVASNSGARPLDVAVSELDPSKAAKQLGWQAQTKMPQVVDRLLGGDLR